jgi:hypothetical protein
MRCSVSIHVDEYLSAFLHAVCSRQSERVPLDAALQTSLGRAEKSA